MNYLQKAIDAVGSQLALAKAIGTSQQNVSYWMTRLDGVVPAQYAIPIEKATNGAVKRNELRPDLYPDHETTAA